MCVSGGVCGGVCVCVCVSGWVRRARGSLDGWCMFVWCGWGVNYVGWMDLNVCGWGIFE